MKLYTLENALSDMDYTRILITAYDPLFDIYWSLTLAAQFWSSTQTD